MTKQLKNGKICSTVYIKKALHTKIKMEAIKRQTSMSGLMEQALEVFLKRPTIAI